MNKTIIKNILLFIFIFGLYGSGSLAYNEFLQAGTCPNIGGIPACYIIFTCLLIPFITHIFNWSKLVYFLFTLIALTIAVIGTLGQLLNKVQCPKTSEGIPMCYISLIIFTSLIVLKLILLKKKRVS